jgi:hypothetical protein
MRTSPSACEHDSVEARLDVESESGLRIGLKDAVSFKADERLNARRLRDTW